MTTETDFLSLIGQSINETETSTWILPSKSSTDSDIAWIGTNSATIEGSSYKEIDLELGNSSEFKAFHTNSSEFSVPVIFGTAQQPKRDPKFNVSNPPGPPKVVSKDSTSVTLMWNPPPSSDNAILGYYLEYRAPNGTWNKANEDILNGTIYKVTGLTPAGDYEFRVIAENSNGLSDPSESSGTVDLNPNDDHTTNQNITSDKAASASSSSRIWIWLIQTLGCVFLLSILGFSICANLYFK